MNDNKKVALKDAPIGLFLYNDVLCLKTEYYTYLTEKDSIPDCFTVYGGERFHPETSGGAENYNNTMVLPVYLIGFDHVESDTDDSVILKAEEYRSMTRSDILSAAEKCVCGSREQDYGSVENNFQTIANLWIDYLQGKEYPVDIEPKDVAAMLILLKIARISSGHAKDDNWIDAAGYASLGGELESMKKVKLEELHYDE